MKKLKLMPDYQCFPIWKNDAGQVGNVDPEALPISKELREKILTWAKVFDSTLNEDDPINSGFQSEQAELEFKELGRTLGALLQLELGPAYLVEVKV